MCLFINDFPNDLYDLTLKDLIIIEEPFNKNLKLSCFLLINQGWEDILDEELLGGFIQDLHLWVKVGEVERLVVTADDHPVRHTDTYHISSISEGVYFILFDVRIGLL